MENEIILYTDENGKTNVSVRFADEDVWVTQNQLAEIYNTTQQNISLHIDNIYKDEELPEASTHKDFLLVQKEGKRNVKRNISHYNLDVIIAIGYRVHEHTAAELIYERVDSEKPFVGMTNFKGDSKNAMKIVKSRMMKNRKSICSVLLGNKDLEIYKKVIGQK